MVLAAAVTMKHLPKYAYIDASDYGASWSVPVLAIHDEEARTCRIGHGTRVRIHRVASSPLHHYEDWIYYEVSFGDCKGWVSGIHIFHGIR